MSASGPGLSDGGVVGLQESRSPLSVDAVLERIASGPAVPDSEEVDLTAALGRTLADDIRSAVPLPPFDNSAMDGYAFRFADLPGDRRLALAVRIAAGSAAGAPLPAGAAARIFTGAALPEGADTVALQEHCRTADGWVTLPEGMRSGANRRRAGEDVGAGDLALRGGTRVGPHQMALLAAMGQARVRVRRRVRVAVLSTGRELRAPGVELSAGAIHDSNRPAIAAALAGLGAEATDLGIVDDDLATLRQVLAAAGQSHDLIISSGGVSVGEEDHVRAAVQEMGELTIWRVAMRPGKPVAIGKIGETAFVGLPGNPVAALIAFWVFARPLLRRLQGATGSAMPTMSVIAGFDRPHPRGRRDYLRVRLNRGGGRDHVAVLSGKTGAAMLSSLACAEGLAVIGEDQGDVRRGDRVDYLPFEGLFG